MIVNCKNATLINTEKFYIHDDVLHDLHFNRRGKALTLCVEKNLKNEIYEIKFCQVFGFSMTDCDFWGASERICDIEYVSVNEQVLMPKLVEKYSEVEINGELSLEECFETVLVFVSGDELRIVCKSIEVSDTAISGTHLMKRK